jgi:hypothetical protein
MADIASSIIQKQISSNVPGMEKQTAQQTQTGRSFENILQNGSQQTTQTENNQPVSNITDDKKLDGMRRDLIERYNSLPNGVPSVSAVFPEFLDTKTSMSGFRKLLDEAMSGGLNSSKSKDVMGKLTDIETEFKGLDALMRSDKNLSQGQLLGVQARLYQVSQHIEVLSKVVDQMTGGVKTVLNTNV